MKVVYTDEALQDLDKVLTYIGLNYPTSSAAFQKRLRTAVVRIGAWPQSAEEIADRPGIRVVPLITFPYKVFYRITNEAVEILHIRHAARRQPWEDER
jgi:toxin ParE1/3/4